ncbi:MAG: glycosyltransferase family 87 protein [Candidatus Limnocylindrales bacterium]
MTGPGGVVLERLRGVGARLPLPGPVARRRIIFVTSGVLLALAAWEFVWLWGDIDEQHAIGLDFAFYKSVGDHWLATGQFYLPHQLSGPYVVRTEVDVLYPPLALFLFVPFHWLPFWLWWVIPIGIVGYAVWRLRPARWSWPVLAFLLCFPKTPSETIYGNSDMWVTALVAAGLLWSWPSVLVFIKPSLLPLAFIGVRRRSWWIAAVLLGVASLPLLGLWLDYPIAMRNSSAAWYYSLGNLPMVLIPVAAWLGRRPSSRESATVPAGTRSSSHRQAAVTASMPNDPAMPTAPPTGIDAS